MGSVRLQGFQGCRGLSVRLSRKAGVLCKSGTRKGAGVLRTTCLDNAAGSRGKDHSGRVVQFNRGRSRVHAIMRGGRGRCRVSVRLEGDKSGNITIGGVPVGGTDRLFKVLGVIFFSPRSLGVVGGKPTREEEFVSLRLYRLSGLCLSSLSDFGGILGREGGLLGSVSFHPSLISALPM